MALLEELNSQMGVTVLMVTHDPALAARYARRSLHMADGRLLGGGGDAMTRQDLFELAARNMRNARLRNALTTIGIAVGVASLVAMMSLGYRPAALCQPSVDEERHVPDGLRHQPPGPAQHGGQR